MFPFNPIKKDEEFLKFIEKNRTYIKIEGVPFKPVKKQEGSDDEDEED
jgi:hypothetical protein